jgi:phosphoenolpyruvate-protein phosphotransferase (PTS system enzyme I)
VDGTTGEITVDPDADDANRRVGEARAAWEGLERWTGPGATADGTPVKLLANVADGVSARSAAEGPVEGVGLFRTELSFLNRKEEPSVDEQADIYAEVLAPFSGKRYVVVRTLDAGSDKPIAFATHAGEENPALGVRGLRLSLGNPGLMERQLAGIAAAAERTGTETWVMAPMVATVGEASEFATQVRALGMKAGVMVEIPSAALLAHQMLEVVDFLSIGTNDLTQYTMAADRMATDLAHLTDAWQPAVLQLIAITAEAGRRAGKPVGVCGEAAADPMLATALVGMGITSLSMALAAVRPVGAQLAAVTMDTCEHAAEAALAAVDPMAARDAVLAVLSSPSVQ